MFNENVNVHIELTDKCNALCSMCGRQYIENGELKKVPTFDKNELSITEIRNIFDNRFLILSKKNHTQCKKYVTR